MASLGYDEEALEDVARIALFLLQAEPGAVDSTLDLIRTAIQILEAHPLIGRPLRGDLRELVVSQGATGYVALYSYSQISEHVQVHRIRHQRESGFEED